jgi:hypothetical protein
MKLKSSKLPILNIQATYGTGEPLRLSESVEKNKQKPTKDPGYDPQSWQSLKTNVEGLIEQSFENGNAWFKAKLRDRCLISDF